MRYSFGSSLLEENTSQVIKVPQRRLKGAAGDCDYQVFGEKTIGLFVLGSNGLSGSSFSLL